MSGTNHRITLARRPTGPVDPSCFAADDVPIEAPGAGQVLVEVGWLSIDPTIRGWMAQDTYLPAIAIGEPIRSGGIGTVIESNADTLPVGSRVFGMTGWQQYAVMDGSAQVIPEGIDPQAALSVFGVTGITAYFGLLDVGRPAAGETVLVSGAAGATGSVAGMHRAAPVFTSNRAPCRGQVISPFSKGPSVNGCPSKTRERPSSGR